MQESRLDVDALLAQRDWLLGLARRLSRTEADADDLVQGTYAVALSAPGAAVRAPRAWLASVTRSLAGRGAARDRARAERERASVRDGDAPSAADLAARTEAFGLLANCVVALPEPYREAVLLRYFEGLSPSAVGERLGVPASTVRTRLARALSKLRAELAARDPEDRWIAALAPALMAPRGAKAALAMAAALTVGVGGVLTARALGAPEAPHAEVPTQREAAVAPRKSEPLAELHASATERVAQPGSPPEAVTTSATVPPPETARSRGDAPAPPPGTLEIAVTLDGAPLTTGTVLLDVSGPRPRGGRPDPGLFPGGATLSSARDLDAEGVVYFDGLAPGGWQFAVCLDQDHGQQYMGVLPEDTGARVELGLTTARLTGHAYDVDGNPIADAWVSLSPTVNRAEGILTKTGADGAYTITNAFPCLYWASLHPGVETPTHRNDVGPMQNVRIPAEGETVHDFGSPDGLGTLTLRIVSRAGGPPILRRGFGVHLDGDQGNTLYHGLTLDEAGGYAAEKRLESGTWKVQTTDATDGHSRRLLTTVEMDAEDDAVELVLPGARVEVELAPALDALATIVSVRRVGGQRTKWYGVRTQAGRWIVDGVYPGEWELVARDRNGDVNAPVLLSVHESDVTLFERLTLGD
ncbi:MAG: sigma-70 family RNA polymerase sigma factor [Planctomycetota bacterium]